MRLTDPMKRFLKTALNNPKPGKGEGGIVYVCPEAPYLNKVRYVWYRATYDALTRRGLIEYKERLKNHNAKPGDSFEFYLASVLTDRGIEEARKLP